jgi:hypothetical protein
MAHVLAQLERAREALARGRQQRTLTPRPDVRQAAARRVYGEDGSRSSAFEIFLARLYVDASVRARFLADPLAEATRAGLTAPEVQALQHIDRVGLALAARSFAHKRQQGRRRRVHPRWPFSWSI